MGDELGWVDSGTSSPFAACCAADSTAVSYSLLRFLVSVAFLVAAFGRVTGGLEVLDKLDDVETDGRDRPIALETVKILEAYEGEQRKRGREGDESHSEEEERDRKKKKKEKKGKKHKKSKKKHKKEKKKKSKKKVRWTK